jgi:hypothetical protein
VSQEIVGRPSQIGDLRNKIWLDPMNAGQDERRAEAGLRGDVVRAKGSRPRTTSGRSFLRSLLRFPALALHFLYGTPRRGHICIAGSKVRIRPRVVLPLLTSLLAPLGLPLPPLDMPVPPPPAANAELGIKISATVAKDLRVITSSESRDVFSYIRRRSRNLVWGRRRVGSRLQIGTGALPDVGEIGRQSWGPNGRRFRLGSIFVRFGHGVRSRT